MRKPFFITGLLLVAFAAVWYQWIGPRWRVRVFPGWQWNARFVGVNATPDPQTGQYGKESATLYEREMGIESIDVANNTARIVDRYTTRDLQTNRVTWEYIFRASIDPRTGSFAEEPFRGDQYLFPPNAQKTTYRIRMSYIKGLPLTFEREELVEGVETFLYSYNGRGEYTESYAGTSDYPGIKVEKGHEIKRVDDQLVLRMWVEPVTGNLVKLDESCYSGDAVVEIALNKTIMPIMRWGGVTAGGDVVDRAESTASMRWRALLMSRYAPASFGVVGLVFVVASFTRRGRASP